MSRKDAVLVHRRLQADLKAMFTDGGSHDRFWDWMRRASVVDWAHGSRLSWPRYVPSGIPDRLSSVSIRVRVLVVVLCAVHVSCELLSPIAGTFGSVLVEIASFLLLRRNVEADLMRSELQRMAREWRQEGTEDDSSSSSARARHTWVASVLAEPGSLGRLVVYLAGVICGLLLLISHPLLIPPGGILIALATWLYWADVRSNSSPPYALLLGRSGPLGTELHRQLHEAHYPARVVSLLNHADRNGLAARRMRCDVLRVRPAAWARKVWPHVVANLMASSSMVVFDFRVVGSSSLQVELVLARSIGKRYLQFGEEDGLTVDDYFQMVRRNQARFW